ncbi:MAG TPA: hypothetical protein VMP01_02780 [Pirellulaceae bacterium]|nr:hypothetical protein [Pirellulaceae bacterium]
MDTPISAHFDGQSIVSDEPVPFTAGQKLVVGPLPAAPGDVGEELPLESCDGDIRLKGHRISLGLFLEEYFRLKDPAAIQARFSTLEPAEIERLIEFVEANRPLMLVHAQAHTQFAKTLFASMPKGPSLDELRQRAAARGIPLKSEG